MSLDKAIKEAKQRAKDGPAVYMILVNNSEYYYQLYDGRESYLMLVFPDGRVVSK